MPKVPTSLLNETISIQSLTGSDVDDRGLSTASFGSGTSVQAKLIELGGSIESETEGRIERNDFKNIKVEKVSVKDIPYADNFFDVVHVFGILHHITDVDVGVKEILRVLKPGGSVYAMFYNKNSLLYYHSIMYLRGVVNGEFERGLTEEDLVSKYSEAETGCPYTKIYTEDSVEKLFYDNGFGKVETQIDSPHIDTLEERKVEIKNLPRNLGWHISTKATK